MSERIITDEERAQSALEGWQAEERFTAHRNARRRRQALEFRPRSADGRVSHPSELALQAGTATGLRTRKARSLPSGPAPDMRVLALGLVLLIPSAIGLRVAVGGYVGIAALRAGWDYVTRRKS